MDQKWINESGIFYPIPGNTKLYSTPGPGVFQVYKSLDPRDGRIGLKNIGEDFKFNFRLYDIGSKDIIERIYNVWNNNYFINKNTNLGVIFNGIRGTGKTISAKLLCNEMNMPTVVIPYYIDGIQDFIQSLEFECSILIDEAEKTFKRNDENNADEVLLKLIDGVYNKSRKLYILTTNELSINQNLLGRPGRIRYIQQFGNLSKKAIDDFIEDNLNDKKYKEDILKTIDLLEISTIDILRTIVDEINMNGKLEESVPLNIPKANHVFKVLIFPEVEGEKLAKLKELLVPHITKGDMETWLNSKNEELGETNMDTIYNLEGDSVNLTTKYSGLFKGMDTNYGEILEEPDKDGFFVVAGRAYNTTPMTCVIVNKKFDPSLYRGKL